MKIKQFSSRFLPKYSRIPLLVALIFQFGSYFLTQIVMIDATHYKISLPIDKYIPFVPFFVVFYVLGYLQWVASFIYNCSSGKENCYRITTAHILAMLMSLPFFILLPTTIDRPDITGNGIFELLIKFIYSVDSPAANLIPSYHCIVSWMCFKGSLLVKKAPRWYSFAQLIFSLFVFASTVLIKQHFVIDIFAGLLIVEIAWFISKHFCLWETLKKLKMRHRKT